MRPTPEKYQDKFTDKDGTNHSMDPVIREKVPLLREDSEVWLEFASSALSGLAGNTDVTPNNLPTFITDEACLMADRMLLAFKARFPVRQ